MVSSSSPLRQNQAGRDLKVLEEKNGRGGFRELDPVARHRFLPLAILDAGLGRAECVCAADPLCPRQISPKRDK